MKTSFWILSYPDLCAVLEWNGLPFPTLVPDMLLLMLGLCHILLSSTWSETLPLLKCLSPPKKVPFNCLNKSYELKTWVLQCPTSNLWHVTVWIWYSQDYDYVLITIISGRHYRYTHIQTGFHQSHNILCSRRQDWKLNPYAELCIF